MKSRHEFGWPVRTLEQIFEPLPFEELLRTYWGQRAVHVRGTADKFAGVFSLDRFRRLLREAPAASTIVTATFHARDGRPESKVHIAPGEATEAFHAGATICVTWIDTLDAQLTELCRGTRVALGLLGDVHMNAYWSPPGAGFDTHFDARIATTLQIEGDKTWQFTKLPAIPWPAANARWRDGKPCYADDGSDTWEYDIDPEAMASWDEVTMRPGDVLCLPAGAVHQVKADTTCLALNLHFGGADPASFLGRWLASTLADRPQWRHVPPLLGRNGFHGGISPAATAFLVERLDEAIAQLTAWRGAPETLVIRAVADVATDAARRHGTSPRPRGDDPLLVPSPLLAVVERRGRDGVTCVLGDQRIDASGPTARVLSAALDRGVVRASELAPEGDTDARRQVDGLVELRVLVDAESARGDTPLSGDERAELLQLRNRVREYQLREAATR